MKITLDVPDHVRYQLVYRLERTDPFPVQLQSDDRFYLVDSAAAAVKSLRTLAAVLGVAGAAKAVAKIATGSRHFYYVLRGGRPVSYGWGTSGRCSHYKVERESVVIGPIWTDPAARGGGLATAALAAAINEWAGHGRRLFYIDTSNENLAAQRVFAKCGFGQPIALYVR